MSAFYQEHLATVHDRYYASLSLEAADFVMRCAQEQGLPQPRIVDLGCGSGSFAAEMSKHGARLIGVDYSSDMIALARSNAPLAQFECCSLFDYSVPPCDIVCALGEALNYLFDSKSSLETLEHLLRNIHSSLSANGFFVFDILNPDVFREPSSRRISHPYADVVVEILPSDPDILSRRITTYLSNDLDNALEVEVHHQRLYSTEEISKLLSACDFGFQTLTSYSVHPFRRGHTAFRCWKVNG